MITQKNAERLAELQEIVEKALMGAARASKKLVVETLALEGECSKGSSGFEKSFLKALKSKQVPLTARFATLMGESAGRSAGRPVSETTSDDSGKSEQGLSTHLNLKSVSLIKVDQHGNAKASYIGGSEVPIGKLDESALRSSSTLLEFSSASS